MYIIHSKTSFIFRSFVLLFLGYVYVHQLLLAVLHSPFSVNILILSRLPTRFGSKQTRATLKATTTPRRLGNDARRRWQAAKSVCDYAHTRCRCASGVRVVCVCVSWGVLCVMWVHRFLIIINNNSRNTFNFFLRSRRPQDAVGFCLVQGITGWVCACVCVWANECVCVCAACVGYIPRAACCHFCLNDIALTATSRRVAWQKIYEKIAFAPVPVPHSSLPLSAVEAASPRGLCCRLSEVVELREKWRVRCLSPRVQY